MPNGKSNRTKRRHGSYQRPTNGGKPRGNRQCFGATPVTVPNRAKLRQQRKAEREAASG